MRWRVEVRPPVPAPGRTVTSRSDTMRWRVELRLQGVKAPIPSLTDGLCGRNSVLGGARVHANHTVLAAGARLEASVCGDRRNEGRGPERKCLPMS